MVDRGSGPPTNETTPVDSSGIDFRRLVSDHYEAVFRYAFRLSGRQADAEDLTQQAYLLAQQKLHQVREADKVDRWLYAIVRSCFLKGLARNRMTLVDSLEATVEDLSESVRQAKELDAEELQRALSELVPEYRVILMMFYFDELSYKEIAEQLEIPMGTVMSRLARAKARLRDKLAPAPAMVTKG